jgi:hypothetical protein
MQMFAWFELRWRQAFLACDANSIGTSGLRWHGATQRLASLVRRGGPKNLIERNSLAFPVSFFEGSALNKQFRFSVRVVRMLFGFYSFANQTQQHAFAAFLKV